MTFAIPDYTPANWYWIVAGDEARAWSSAVSAYVPAGDAAFQAWLVRNIMASRIPSEEELSAVLAPYGLIGPYQHLQAYAANKRWAVETGGITVGGAAIPTDRSSQAMISGAYSFAQASPDATINFKGTDGWVTLSSEQMMAIGIAVGSHVQDCFTAEAGIDADISTGAIESVEQIDADARWPG